MTDPRMSYKIKCDWLANQRRRDRNGNPIEMLLTYEEWAQVWKDSGHWGKWGNRKGDYVMSRKDDLGSYAIGNVFIQSVSDNVAEANRRRTGKSNPMFGRRDGGAKTKLGLSTLSEVGKATTQYDYSCPHCGKEGKGPGMMRWHFDKCRLAKVAA